MQVRHTGAAAMDHPGVAIVRALPNVHSIPVVDLGAGPVGRFGGEEIAQEDEAVLAELVEVAVGLFHPWNLPVRT